MCAAHTRVYYTCCIFIFYFLFSIRMYYYHRPGDYDTAARASSRQTARTDLQRPAARAPYRVPVVRSFHHGLSSVPSVRPRNRMLSMARWLFAESRPTNGTTRSRGKTVTTTLRLGLTWLIWYGSAAAPCCNRVPIYHLSKTQTREPRGALVDWFICW